MERGAEDVPGLLPLAQFHRPQRTVPVDVAVQMAAARIALDPLVKEGQSVFALAHFIEQVSADVRGMRAARKSDECRFDVALPASVHLKLDFRKGKLGAEPPIVAVVRR